MVVGAANKGDVETRSNDRAGPVPAGVADPSPSERGYRLAALVRQRAGLQLAKPVPSVKDVAYTVAQAPLCAEEQNHVPGSGVRAAVGWLDNPKTVVAGPLPQQ